jgi:hypothetical protein
MMDRLAPLRMSFYDACRTATCDRSSPCFRPATITMVSDDAPVCTAAKRKPQQRGD